jgi:flagellar M-ring protein FliF
MVEFSKIISQTKQLYNTLNKRQRWSLLGGAAATIAVLVGCCFFLASPDYKPLVNNMDPADAQKLGSQLASKNIPYQISPDGKSISVPADKLDSTRLELASTGMPNSGRLGFEIFDKANWGQTEFDEKVNYQRALEGELERTISALKGVEAARVHLVMPEDSVFIDRERTAKASVILKLRSGNLPDETQVAIAKLVAGAVDRLSPDNVTVIDGDTNRPLGNKHNGSPFGEDAEQQLTAKLLANLGPVVGPEKMRTTVGVEFDPSTTEENSEKYDPQSVVAVTSQRSEERIGGDGLTGAPGTASNVPSTANTSIASDNTKTSDGTQTSKTENSTYAVNKVVRHTLEPAGRIRRITAALVLDDVTEAVSQNGRTVQRTRKRTPEELKQIEELAKASIGIDPTRGDSLTVENISFSHRADGPAPPTFFEKTAKVMRDYSSVLRYGSIISMFLLAYVLLLKPVKKQVLALLESKKLPNPEVTVAIEEPEPALLTDELSSEQQMALALKKHVIEKATNEPAAASRVVQSWLREDAQ